MSEGIGFSQGQSVEPPTSTAADTDIAMNDAPNASTPTIGTPTHNRVSTPTGARTSTPQRNGSQLPIQSTGLSAVPTQALPNGAKCRQYLNEKVTAVLLEGMRRVASEQPDAPLKVLGEFLLAKSKELEPDTH